MTLLRRTAQLVEDLRTLGIIEEDERILVEQIKSGIALRIAFRSVDEKNKQRKELIADCVSEEFSKNEFEILDLDWPSWMITIRLYRIG